MTDENQEPSSLELGSILKEARENSGLSLIELSEKLRLPAETIEKLEKEQFSDLPGNTYTRAYIKTLAEEYGLDQAEILRIYLKATEQAPIAEAVETINFNTRGTSLEVKPKQNYGKLLLLITGLIVIALVWRFFTTNENSPTPMAEVPHELIAETLKADSIAKISSAQKDSILKDSIDQIVESDSSIAALIAVEDSLVTPVKDTIEVEDKGTSLKIKVVKDSTWYLVKSKDVEDEARWIRSFQSPMTINRKDTVYVEFGNIRQIELKINNKVVTPKRNIFRVFNGEILGN